MNYFIRTKVRHILFESQVSMDFIYSMKKIYENIKTAKFFMKIKFRLNLVKQKLFKNISLKSDFSENCLTLQNSIEFSMSMFIENLIFIAKFYKIKLSQKNLTKFYFHRNFCRFLIFVETNYLSMIVKHFSTKFSMKKIRCHFL